MANIGQTSGTWNPGAMRAIMARADKVQVIFYAGEAFDAFVRRVEDAEAKARMTHFHERTGRAPAEPVAGLPVKGYAKTQTPEAIAAVDVFKELEERALRHAEALMKIGDIDPRFMAIGMTQMQTAFMLLNRAIFQPGRVKLPEDEQRGLRIGPQWLKEFYDNGNPVRRKSWPVGDYISSDGAEGGTIWYYTAKSDDLTPGYRLDFHDLGTDEWEVIK